MARKPRAYTPSPELLAALPDASGNAINGLGERTPRRASPMFWHPADQHPFGAVQAIAGASCRATEEARNAFAAAYDHPALEPISADRAERGPEAWTDLACAFALANEADLFGTTDLKDHYVVEGYSVAEPRVIVLGIAHDYERLRQVPSTPENGTGLAEVGRQCGDVPRPTSLHCGPRYERHSRPACEQRADHDLRRCGRRRTALVQCGRADPIGRRTPREGWRHEHRRQPDAAIVGERPILEEEPVNGHVLADAVAPREVCRQIKGVDGDRPLTAAARGEDQLMESSDPELVRRRRLG